MITHRKPAHAVALSVLVAGSSIFWGCAPSDDPRSVQPNVAADMSMLLLASAEESALPEAKPATQLSVHPPALDETAKPDTAPPADSSAAPEAIAPVEPPSQPSPTSAGISPESPPLAGDSTSVMVMPAAAPPEPDERVAVDPQVADAEPLVVARLIVTTPSPVLQPREAVQQAEEAQTPTSEPPAAPSLEQPQSVLDEVGAFYNGVPADNSASSDSSGSPDDTSAAKGTVPFSLRENWDSPPVPWRS